MIELSNMNTVSEAQALKERHMVKHGDLFGQCLQDLTKLMTRLAEDSGLAGPFSIVSRDGIEQIAALLPRTNSDLLRIDSMTQMKVNKYGQHIMETLALYWRQVDEREADDITKQLDKLKNGDMVMGGFAQFSAAATRKPSRTVPVRAKRKTTVSSAKCSSRIPKISRSVAPARALQGKRIASKPSMKRSHLFPNELI
ncbi:unnamed protein product [Caenorhabditis sp. 36 PRJEB53466]|nr:unnamed protein product [Caenorhabditis sp. 36 PRJEB53466]